MGKARPSGPYAAEMTGPGAWPETDEDVFTERANELGGILTKVDAALTTWQGHQATIFNGVHVWSGDASKAAGSAVEGATKAMQDHAKQLRDAIEWCKTAAANIVVAKDLIASNVTAAQQEIQSIENAAAKNNQNPDGAIQTLVQREYKENFDVISVFAMASGAKLEDLPLSPPGEPGKPDPHGTTSPQNFAPEVQRPPKSGDVERVSTTGQPPTPPAAPPTSRPGGFERVSTNTPPSAPPAAPPVRSSSQPGSFESPKVNPPAAPVAQPPVAQPPAAGPAPAAPAGPAPSHRAWAAGLQVRRA
jgi:hypothetical protein